MSTLSDVNLREIQSILVVKLDHLGDFVLASSFLRELRRNVPKARIDLLVTKEVYGLAELCPYVDSVLMAELLNGNLMVTGEPDDDVRACLLRFEQTGYDLAVVPRWDYDYWRASVIARVSRARYVVGFKTPAAHSDKYQTDELYTHLLDRPFAAHEVEHNLAMIQFLGGSIETSGLELWTSPDDTATAERLLSELPGEGALVAVCPGASLARKMVPPAKLARILKRTREMIGPVRYVVLGSAQDSVAGRLLEAQLKNCYDLCGRTTIRETVALIAKCRLLVGMDSAPGHIAAAAGIPSVIFSCFERDGNPMEDCSPVRWRPFGTAESVVLQPPKALWPCKHRCDQDYAHCIMTIEEGHAVAAIADLLLRTTGEMARLDNLVQLTSLAEHLGTSQAEQGENCRLCGGPTQFLFTKVLLGKHNVRFSKCLKCESMQTERPFWLDEAYADTRPLTDCGMATRTLETVLLADLFFSLCRVGETDICVDVGGGNGLFTRLMRDRGYNFHNSEPFTANFYAPFHDATNRKIQKAAVVTAFEVMEHLPEPAEGIEKIFDYEPDLALLSTELYRGQPEDWWYCAPDIGQHVFFYSIKALEMMAARYKMRFVSNGSTHLFFRTTPRQLKYALADMECLIQLFNDPAKLRAEMLRQFSIRFNNPWKYVQRDYAEIIDQMGQVNKAHKQSQPA
jgi:ADP-heptose:LPS heptosyltransferase